jgi:hypothetical protein
MSPDERFWFHRGRYEERARIIAEGRARFVGAVRTGTPESRAADLIAEWLRSLDAEPTT